MAFYKNPDVLTRSDDRAFDIIWSPGQTPPYAGIYKCTGCGVEIAANVGAPLPPQNHHVHAAQQGSIRWQLIVAS